MALIYIVEDDENILEIEEIALRNANYQVSGFSSARDMYEKLSKIKPDLFLLDIMLPDEDGNQILRNLRKNPETARIPAIMVTAKSSEIDLIKAFDEGSDDYIKKPFSIMELTSRVKAVLRRTNKNEDEHIVINYKDLNLNDEKRKVSISGENIDLTYKEYELSRYLLVNKGIVLSREKIRFVGRTFSYNHTPLSHWNWSKRHYQHNGGGNNRNCLHNADQGKCLL